jgi:hypothetical protein
MKLITQFRDKNRIAGFLWSLADSRAVILGIALLHLIVTYMWVRNWYAEFGQGPVSVYPDAVVNVPLVLVFASLLIVIGRGWSYVLALMISVWVLYSVGYGAIRGVAAAHDLSLLTFAPYRVWFTHVWVGQPQQFLQLALALVIGGYSLAASSELKVTHSERMPDYSSR